MPDAPSDCGLTRFRADSAIDDIVSAVRRDGGAIVSGLLGTEQFDSIVSELAPHVDARPTGFRGFAPDAFYGSNTKRIQGLAAKSRAFVDHVLLSPVLLAVADAILLPNCGDYWMSQAETIYIGPGNKAQALHRDDINWSRAARLGIDLQVSALVAVGDYDAAVGATMIVPGADRAHDAPFDPSLAVPVELEPGDALLYLGSLVHGGGANTTSDRWRRAVYVGYLLGWLTPEESVPLSVPEQVAATLPERARRLLGWSNIRGNRPEDGVASQLQLWQMDQNDAARFRDAWVDHD